MLFIKNFFNWCLVLCKIAIITIVIDFVLLKLLFFVDGTPFMLFWYALLFLIPMCVHFLILKASLPSNKKLAAFIALGTTIIMQLCVYYFLLSILLNLAFSTVKI